MAWLTKFLQLPWLYIFMMAAVVLYVIWVTVYYQSPMRLQ